MDTLTASRVLRRLRDRGLLEKHGAGNRTYYSLLVPNIDIIPSGSSERSDKYPPANSGGLVESPQARPQIPPSLQQKLLEAGAKPRQEVVRKLLLKLCSLQPMSANELCQALGRKDSKELRRTYLRPMVSEGLLKLKYPETANHPHQAYKAAVPSC